MNVHSFFELKFVLYLMQNEKQQLKHKIQQTFFSVQDQNTYLWGLLFQNRNIKQKADRLLHENFLENLLNLFY